MFDEKGGDAPQPIIEKASMPIQIAFMKEASKIKDLARVRAEGLLAVTDNGQYVQRRYFTPLETLDGWKFLEVVRAYFTKKGDGYIPTHFWRQIDDHGNFTQLSFPYTLENPNPDPQIKGNSHYSLNIHAARHTALGVTYGLLGENPFETLSLSYGEPKVMTGVSLLMHDYWKSPDGDGYEAASAFGGLKVKGRPVGDNFIFEGYSHGSLVGQGSAPLVLQGEKLKNDLFDVSEELLRNPIQARLEADQSWKNVDIMKARNIVWKPT